MVAAGSWAYGLASVIFTEPLEMWGRYAPEYLAKALKALGSISNITNSTTKKKNKNKNKLKKKQKQKKLEMCICGTVAFCHIF